MRCEDARRRLRADARDRQASRHLESCAACFEALESGDPLAGALRGARPDDAPAPAGLADAVLARRGRSGVRPLVMGGLVAAAIAIVGAADLATGVVPPWVGAAAGGAAGALAPLVAVRDILLGQPAVFAAFAAATVALCGLWLRLALRLPDWRIAR